MSTKEDSEEVHNTSPQEEPSTSCGDEIETEKKKKKKKKKYRARKHHKYSVIRKQMEFYFSDANIRKDRMMKQKVLESELVDLNVFLNFNKIKTLCENLEVLQRALKDSTKLELSQDMNAVKRKIPFDESNVKSEDEVEGCTIYVENIPLHVDHDWVEKVFQEFGPVAYISLPKFRHNGKPKGFAFVEYENEEGAKSCLEAFGELGACLPSSVDPAELLSINSYVEDTDNSNPVHIEPIAVDEHIENNSKSETQIISEEKMDSDTKEIRGNKRHAHENTNTEVIAKKRKKLEGGATGSRDTESEPQTGSKENTIDPGNPENEIFSESVNIVATSPTNENNGGSNFSNNTVQDTTQVSSRKSGKKKNRKRKKKRNLEKVKREEKLESESIQLRILPKKHWRQLRNRYLNLQRENMAKLKRHMRMQRFQTCENEPTFQSQFISKHCTLDENKTQASKCPSVCIKIVLDTPAKSAEVFKAKIGLELAPKDWPNIVRFVDYNDGGLEAIVRLISPEKAIQTFLDNANRVYNNVTRLTDEETTNYWKLVKAEQARKKKELKKKSRGKDRLLNQAEKLANHIRFDDETNIKIQDSSSKIDIQVSESDNINVQAQTIEESDAVVH